MSTRLSHPVSALKPPVSRPEVEVSAPALLGEPALASFAQTHPGWTREGDELRRTFGFSNFRTALAFVAKLERPAEDANHHPDIDIRYNQVKLGLTTHDAGGLTSLDTELAHEADARAQATAAVPNFPAQDGFNSGGNPMAYDKTQLTAEQVKAFLAEHKGWTRQGDELRRTFEFKGFPEALAFVAKLERPAESANHHPDIDIRYNKVTLALTTHDAGGLTFRDTDLAKIADGLAS